jgi:hypothetical protein
MRLRALTLALTVLAGLVAPASAAGGNKATRRLGAAYAKKRAANPPPLPLPVPLPVVSKKSRVQSSGMSCRSSAKG